MPIEFSTGGPGAILETMIEQKWGDALLRLPRNTARTIEEAKAGFEAGDTFRIFYPILQDIIGGVLVDDRTAQGWRCLLSHRSQVLAQLETERNGRPLAIHMGQAKDGIAQAMALAAQLDGRYLVDAVEVSALKLCALRLCPADAEPRRAEYLIPYEPDASGLPAYTATPVAEAMTLLIPLAKRILEMSEADPLSGG